jgi:hypothetical protein
MTKRSLRGLLRKKRTTTTDKKAMTPQMRELMSTFTGQNAESHPHVKRSR